MAASPHSKQTVLLVTCEHGGNRVPASYRSCFREERSLLGTHQAFDLGALELARRLARRFDAVSICSTVTRLLVDLNRSLSNPRVFSGPARRLDSSAQNEILDQYYHPYRNEVEAFIQTQTQPNTRLVHVSVHSFTPRLNEKERNADVGLLYDPQRAGERRLCLAWQSEVRRLAADLVLRRNYPYRGTDDGLTSHLRKRFDSRRYLGIELEVNQKWPRAGGKRWSRLQSDLIESLAAVVS